MKKTLAILLTICLSASLFAQGTTEAAAPATEAETITIVDHGGRSVTLPRHIKRLAVVNPWPLAAVVPIFLGGADRLVGMPAGVMGAIKSGLLGEIYPSLTNVPTAFNPEDNVVNVEELMKLQPDVVLTMPESDKTNQAIRDAGIPCVGFSVSKWDYNVLETYDNWIKLLSEMFPDESKIESVSAYTHKVADMVQSRVKDIPDSERKKVLFLFQYNEKTIVTSGKRFFGQYWCDAVGAKNVAEEVGAERNNAVVNMEQIYQWDPDLILITNFTPQVPDDLYENKVGSDDWSGVKAVKEKQVYKMPLGTYRAYTPGVDMPLTLMWLAQKAYPELFSDIDLEKETKDYFSGIFGIELTDEQIHKIYNQGADTAEGVHLN